VAMRTDRYFVRLDAARPTVGYMADGRLVEAPGAFCTVHEMIYPAQAERCPLCRQEMVRAWQETQALSRALSEPEPAPLLGVLMVGLSSSVTLFALLKLIGFWR